MLVVTSSLNGRINYWSLTAAIRAWPFVPDS
jgi:hypothetical protein